MPICVRAAAAATRQWWGNRGGVCVRLRSCKCTNGVSVYSVFEAVQWRARWPFGGVEVTSLWQCDRAGLSRSCNGWALSRWTPVLPFFSLPPSSHMSSCCVCPVSVACFWPSVWVWVMICRVVVSVSFSFCCCCCRVYKPVLSHHFQMNRFKSELKKRFKKKKGNKENHTCMMWLLQIHFDLSNIYPVIYHRSYRTI